VTETLARTTLILDTPVAAQSAIARRQVNRHKSLIVRRCWHYRKASQLLQRIPKRFGLDPIRDIKCYADEPRRRGRTVVEHRTAAAPNPTGDRKVERFG
jgi:hypothetical protein